MHPEKQPSFQYISCYSLSHPASQSSAHVRVSIHLMLLFIVFKPLASDSDTLFQYISCYSLSAIEKVILIAKKFQYISCYSLSEICISKKLFFLSFNTSHVTLYLMFPFYDKREPRCFNTSHVTLYRQKKKLLLLRLIGFNTSHVTLYPCPDCCNRKSDQCFNTSHVTLYQEEREIREDKEEVSIHLMLLFIAVPAHVRTDQLEVSIHLMLLFIKRVRIHIHALD